MCGSTEIDGYAFCLGLKSLRKSQKLSYAAFPKLHSLSSLTDLIEQAGLRPKYTASSLERYSLEIRPLVELVDMFRSRQASDLRDRVYALLGMSSDDPGKASLQPDYTISWEALFQQFVNKFFLGKGIPVEISRQRVVIKSKGCILGQVSSVGRDDGQNVNITSRNAAWDLGGKTEWTLPTPAIPFQEHDIICLLHGDSKPTIIRLCQDHFAIVMIAATPLNGSGSFGWPEISQSTTQFLRDFLLIWDWEDPQGKSQDQEGYETLIKTHSQALEYSDFGNYLDEATRLWNDITILEDLGEYEKTYKRLLEARSGYMIAFGKEDPPRLGSRHGRTLLSFAAGEGHEDIVKLLLKSVDPDLKDGKDGRTPLSWAANYGHEAIVKLLLGIGKIDIDSKDYDGDTPLSLAANGGHEAIVKLLLETGRIDINSKATYGYTPLFNAVSRRNEAIVMLLLQTGKVDINPKDYYGNTPLSWAANNGDEAIVRLLLDTGKADINAKTRYYGETALSLATTKGYNGIVKLLLETGKADINAKTSYYGKTALSLAIENEHEAIVKLLLETGKADINAKLESGETALSLATERGHKGVVKLLLETGKVDINAKNGAGETALFLATERGYEDIVKLLNAAI